MDKAGHRSITIHPGAAWAARAACELQRDPAYAELVALVGADAARNIAITAAGHYWNASRSGSSIPPDRAQSCVTRAAEAFAAPGANAGVMVNLADALQALQAQLSRDAG